MTDDKPPEEEFVLQINVAMAEAIQTGADTDAMAKVCLNTAKELYTHYGAGEAHDEFLEFVTSVNFETEEVEQWLDKTDDADSPA